MAALIAKTARLVVNGKPINLSWGLDRPIHDENGHEALGVCENDPELPDTVMISINASLLAHQPEVIRSTAAHEFAHAIFDMPAAMGGNIRRTFRTSVAPAIARPGAPIDWVEWRADEFMGAFLVPADKLARVLPKHASALDLPFHWRAAPDGRSVPFVDLDPSEGTLGLLVDDLAEAFGVTAAFMSVRLAKGGFIGRRFETGSTL
ncbi:ImmA/IrrE family metallo-endopeptidase [Nitrobacter winogradskyi]|uniref:ImmA/IrrE family metallo-endopeptidase n=1 Tax=Nitrobacter winogradskyi TaxID=913 RepID=UPI0011D13665|nr:ImmA/IrrE family metallo-endopeptidase [Nitrobacter winogradskyi]